MKLITQKLLSLVIAAMIATTGFSQETSSTDKDETSESSREHGLRKIASGSALEDMDIDIDIDEEAIEASVESAMEFAREAIEDLDIHIAPIEIDLEHMGIHVDHIVIPSIDIDVDDYFENDMDMDIDVDIDHDHFDREDDYDEDDSYTDEETQGKDKNKVKDKTEKVKDKSEKDKTEKNKADNENNDKAKGLKKIN